MTKEDSLVLKGVAIVMMLLYHLFYCGTACGRILDIEYMGGVDKFFFVRFSEICYPVSLYVMITGYGLFCTYQKLTAKKIAKKVVYIYLHLWLIYSIIVPVACYMRPDVYPGSWTELLKNIFSVSSSYCAEQWFLLPYLILLCLSKWICKLISSWNSILVLVISLVFYALYLGIYQKIGVGCLSQRFGVFVNLYFLLCFMLPFSLGAVAQKEGWIEKITKFIENTFGIGKTFVCAWAILLLLIVVRMIVHNQSIQPIAVLVLFLLFPLLNLNNKVKGVLMYLGKHSMNMWLIHGWICFYLFTEIVCVAKYPIGIFIVTLVWSLLLSIVVEFVYKHLFARYL